jgi:hypothetical protein
VTPATVSVVPDLRKVPIREIIDDFEVGPGQVGRVAGGKQRSVRVRTQGIANGLDVGQPLADGVYPVIGVNNRRWRLMVADLPQADVFFGRLRRLKARLQRLASWPSL